METFNLKTRKDYEDMRKRVEEMKDTNNRDDMMRTIKEEFSNKKGEREKFQEDSTIRYQEEDKRREFCETLRAPAIWNFWGE